MSDSHPHSAKQGAQGHSKMRGWVNALKGRVAAFARNNKFFFMAIVTAAGVVGMIALMKLPPFPSIPITKSPSIGPVKVYVEEVKPDHFQDILQALGSVFGGFEVQMRFETEGTISHFEFQEGDKVRKGDIIAKLDDSDAKLKLKKAEIKLKRSEKLYVAGAITIIELEEAQVEYKLADIEFKKTRLRASRDGILGDKNAEVGEFITPAKRIATLVNIDSVKVKIDIVEKEIDRIIPGQKVLVTVGTYPDVEFTGRVENINIIIQGSKTMTVDVRLTNEGGLLLPGMFARARIFVHEVDNALFVPNDAVEKTDTGSRVFLVDKDSKAEARDVEVSYVSSQFSLIANGLQPGDLVITQRPQDLKPGVPVQIIDKN